MELTCIACPIGCRIVIDSEGLNISGYGCKQGRAYALTELKDPRRVLTAVVAVEGKDDMLPVKTAKPIPKEMMFPAMAVIKTVKIKTPIKIGQILIDNLAGTDIPLVATKTLEN